MPPYIIYMCSDNNAACFPADALSHHCHKVKPEHPILRVPPGLHDRHDAGMRRCHTQLSSPSNALSLMADVLPMKSHTIIKSPLLLPPTMKSCFSRGCCGNIAGQPSAPNSMHTILPQAKTPCLSATLTVLQSSAWSMLSLLCVPTAQHQPDFPLSHIVACVCAAARMSYTGSVRS